ncbi:DUF4160 domain-containing protein [Thioalkalivibrio sp. ALgr1]|uniref:DUF4160 domain-containing protein n=1 Tax=Thioalkalivibrio sp. ALgr1 TaxID=748655 RepID=UPI000A046A95|nr:DUF4160 domain-containing protein [Thioalkalivibrio sp. ALgr1]
MKLSELPVEKLKETPWFHNVDPGRLRSFDDYAAWLEAILHNPCNVWEEDGALFLIEIRQLVTRVNGLKIEVYSNEHPPPHFHVKSPNVDASFDIESCAFLEGKVDSRDRKKIEFWHGKAKPLLIEAWNSTRPTDCTVGLYKGT